MKKTAMLFAAMIFSVGVTVAHAQGGTSGDGPCDSSPENPTLILAALGSTGAGLAALRVRLKARNSRK
jgi:XrtJ-associated TM-motif-TM protein